MGRKNWKLKALYREKAAAANSQPEADRNAEKASRDSDAKKGKEAREQRVFEAECAESSRAATHRSKKHRPKVKSYSCSECSLKFVKKSGVTAHQRIAHTKSGHDKTHKQICTKCGNSYPCKVKRKGKHVCGPKKNTDDENGFESDGASTYADDGSADSDSGSTYSDDGSAYSDYGKSEDEYA